MRVREQQEAVLKFHRSDFCPAHISHARPTPASCKLTPPKISLFRRFTDRGDLVRRNGYIGTSLLLEDADCEGSNQCLQFRGRLGATGSGEQHVLCHHARLIYEALVYMFLALQSVFTYILHQVLHVSLTAC